jgi:hypothetical protein
MRTTHALFFAGAVLVSVAGLSWSQDKSSPSTQPKLTAPHEAQTAVSADNAKPKVEYRVIGYLEKRDRAITIKAGPKGPVYSVKTANAKVLCENLSADQLRAQAPELSEFLKTAVAGTPGAKADARVRLMKDARIR